MSARLTPEAVASRELARLQQRQDRLTSELQDIAMDMARWQEVLAAVNGDHHDDAVEAE